MKAHQDLLIYAYFLYFEFTAFGKKVNEIYNNLANSYKGGNEDANNKAWQRFS